MGVKGLAWGGWIPWEIEPQAWEVMGVGRLDSMGN